MSAAPGPGGPLAKLRAMREQRRDLFEQLRRMTLPPEALLLRRMEGLLFQIASTHARRAPPGAPCFAS